MEASPNPRPPEDFKAPADLPGEVVPLRSWEEPLSEEEEEADLRFTEKYINRQEACAAVPELEALDVTGHLDLNSPDNLASEATLSRVLHELARHRLGTSGDLETIHPESGAIVQIWRDHDARGRDQFHLSYAQLSEEAMEDGRSFRTKLGFVEGTDVDGNPRFKSEKRRRAIDQTSKAWDEQHSAVEEETAEASPLDLASLVRVVMESRDFRRV